MGRGLGKVVLTAVGGGIDEWACYKRGARFARYCGLWVKTGRWGGGVGELNGTKAWMGKKTR